MKLETLEVAPAEVEEADARLSTTQKQAIRAAAANIETFHALQRPAAIDVETTPEQSGKRTRKDAVAGKLTYPGLLGIEGTIAEIDRLQHAALDALQPLGPAADALRALCRHMASRRK